tara:strand:+ start:19896 stop:23093 length:3198 start_codon:yes stop_codon:yes gene_type:complete
MNNIVLRTRVNKLLETKSNQYQKKYFILSTLANSKANKSEKIMSEVYSLCETLNNTNGNMPSNEYLFEFQEKVLAYTGLNYRKINAIQENTKNFIALNYKDDELNSLINEELAKIVTKTDKKINSKLLDTLLESIKKNRNVLIENSASKIFGLDLNVLRESEYKSSNTVDLTSMFDDVKGPSRAELSQIEAEDEEFGLPDNIPEEGGKTVDKIAQIFAPITGKDPKKVSKKELALMLGYTGLGKYDPTAKTYKLSGWEKMERDIVKKMNTYQNTGISIVAKRKWWIIKSIEACLMLEKQAGKAFGTPEDVKSKFNTTDSDQVAAIQTLAKSRRSSGTSLSDAEGRMIMDQLHDVLTQGNYNLENPSITESSLMSLLVDASRYRGSSAKDFARDLEIMYPLTDQRPDFEKVPMQSDEERQQTQGEVESYFAEKEAETKETYGDEIDEETGEPLYADEEQIAKIKAQNAVIVKDELIDEIIKTPSINMTVIEFQEFMKQVDEDVKRLKQLTDKTKDKANPDIFKEFETDSKGNILPDIEAIPDIIPAEGLTEAEKEEMADIIIRLGQKQKITIINLDRRGEIYDELCDKAVSVDEFISFRKGYGLDTSDKPMSWEDIARASYGKFRKGQASRQFGVKTWFRGMFYSLSPENKANIYSFLAEKWYDRLKVLDLIDDKSFVRMPSKTGNPAEDKAVPAADLEKLKAAGKYKRSDKLSSISDTLEMVSKYTQPRYVKRYFDTERDDSLDLAVQEKLESLKQLASSVDEYDSVLKRLETEDPDTAAFALMDTMFNGNSGFRMFATGMLKEYYNDIIWPNVEAELAYAVKQYFDTHYKGSNIGKSLMQGQNADKVKPEEGKELFNKIIYLVMQRTGIPSTGDRLPNVGDGREAQLAYFRGEADPRGDFAKAVMKFNAKSYSNKLYGKTGSTYNPLNRAPFGADDVDMLLADMFNPNGIIGQAYEKLKTLSDATEGDIIAWIGDYPEAKLDQAIILGMSMSDFYRKNDVDPTILEVIEGLGKDTKKALEDYKKQFRGLLLGKDFADYLDYEFGFETLDPKSQGSSNPGGKNFQ